MKKFLLATVMALISSISFAQIGKWAAGLNVGYGSDISKPSIGAKVLYDISEQFTVAPSFNYYFQKKEDGIKANYWDLNGDLHWNVVSKENLKFYPLAGFTYMHGKASVDAEYDEEEEISASDSWLGANVGAGVQFNLGPNFTASIEAKYQIISETAQFVPSLSLMYRF